MGGMASPLLAEAGHQSVQSLVRSERRTTRTTLVRGIWCFVLILSGILGVSVLGGGVFGDVVEGAGLPRARALGIEDSGLSAADVYEQFAPAVVGIRSRDDRFTYVGSGSIVDPSGLVLTSITVAPKQCRDLEVFLSTGSVVPAEVLLTVEDREFSLLRITRAGDYPAFDLGDSSELRLGETSIALGNAFQSIQIDGRVAMTVGLVSGLYDLSTARSSARYTGPVIESSAAVNDYMDGGALVNGRGQLVGILGLNFSPQRWLGTAVPINALKPLFGDYRAWYSDRGRVDSRYLGLELYEAGAGDVDRRHVRVGQVFLGGPASRAGIRTGAVLVSVNDVFVSDLQHFHSLFNDASRERRFHLLVVYPKEDDESPESSLLTITLWKRF
jgi:S1-C subfamily serine protease